MTKGIIWEVFVTKDIFPAFRWPVQINIATHQLCNWPEPTTSMYTYRVKNKLFYGVYHDQILANYTGPQVAKANRGGQWKTKRNIQYIEET